jgi:hypothetical protein
MPFPRLGFHALVVWLIAAAAHAQPSIDATFGAWSHKGVITISGSGFGSKSVAEPVVWDDASGSDLMFKWDGAWPDCTLNGNHNLAYRTPSENGRNIPLPHNRIARYISGAHYSLAPGPQCGYNVILWKKREMTSFPAYSYWSYYQRADDNWTFGADPFGNNFKTFAYSEGVGPYNLPNNWYAEFNPPPTSNTDGASWHLNDDGTGEIATLAQPDRNGHSLFWDAAVNPMSGRWTKVEIEAKYTNLNDGYFKLWENGVLKVDYAGRTDNYSGLGTTRTEGIGGYSSEYPSASNWRYFADVYLDYSRARVILGNAPTFAASTVREVQVPTAWTDSSILITANLGAFADDALAYVYVVDEQGNVNENGVPIRTVAGGPVADNTAPTIAVTAPAGGGTVTGSISISASATDNLGVAIVQFQVDGEDLGPPLTTAPYELSWNSAMEPNGAHVITAVARDLSGNQATSPPVTVTSFNASAPTTKGLVASYAFDEGVGVDALDDSAYRHPAGVISGATWAARGQYGAALSFDGDDDVVTIPHAAALDLSGGMTIEAWVNPSRVESIWQTAVMKELATESVPGFAYGLYATTDTLGPSASINVGTDEHARGADGLPANVWTHLAATYDGLTERLFVNGLEVSSRAVGGVVAASVGPLSIGGNAQWLEENFAGLIDEVRIYNRALSAAEILVDMKTPIRTPEIPDPVIFGPETYAGNGRISLVKKTFDVTDASGEFALRVTNSGVTAGVVVVNGRVVVRPSDFRAQDRDDDDDDDDRWERALERLARGKRDSDSGAVASIEKGIMLRPGSNQILTAFLGRVGTSLTLEIVRHTAPPVCAMTRPTDGATVTEGDRLDVRVDATDNVGVTNVEFESSAGGVGENDRWPPYRASFVVPAGRSQVTVTATAFDAAGQTGTCSVTVTVVPAPPPVVTIASLAPGTTLTAGATIPVLVRAASDRHVERIDLQVNGVLFATAPKPDAEFLFTVPAGVSALSFTASAVDSAGATGTSDVVAVSVVPDAMTTVQGRLIDKSNRSVSGAEVELSMGGLSAEIFTFDSTLNEMPSLVGRTPTRRMPVSAANWRNPNFVFGDTPFGAVGTSQVVRMTGKLRIDRSGLYTFVLGVNEGGRLMLGGWTVVNLSTGIGMFQQGSIRVWLPEGWIPIQIMSFGNGNPEVQLSYEPPGGALQVVPTRVLRPATNPYEALSNAAGMFSVAGVPTVLGEIEVSASYEAKKGKDIEGEADPVDPVPDGITNVGLIRLR